MRNLQQLMMRLQRRLRRAAASCQLEVEGNPGLSEEEVMTAVQEEWRIRIVRMLTGHIHSNRWEKLAHSMPCKAEKK
jgi:hypothetical protein